MYTRHTAVPLSARTIRVRRYPSYSSSKKVFSRLHWLSNRVPLLEVSMVRPGWMFTFPMPKVP